MVASSSQRGNILFLILLAVVLFAALSYAVTQSLRSGGNNVSKEAAQSAAAEIMNYASLIEQTVQRLELSNNCTLSEISFENNVVSGYANTAAPRANKSCNIFDANGGALAWKTPDPEWLEDATTSASYSYYPSQYGTFNIPRTVCIKNIALSACINLTSDEKSLILGLKYLKKEICDAINASEGFTTNTTAITASPAGDSSIYWGAFQNNGQFLTTSQSGRRTGCIYSNRSGYTFWHVLKAQ